MRKWQRRAGATQGAASAKVKAAGRASCSAGPELPVLNLWQSWPARQQPCVEILCLRWTYRPMMPTLEPSPVAAAHAGHTVPRQSAELTYSAAQPGQPGQPRACNASAAVAAEMKETRNWPQRLGSLEAVRRLVWAPVSCRGDEVEAWARGMRIRAATTWACPGRFCHRTQRSGPSATACPCVLTQAQHTGTARCMPRSYDKAGRLRAQLQAWPQHSTLGHSSPPLCAMHGQARWAHAWPRAQARARHGAEHDRRAPAQLRRAAHPGGLHEPCGHGRHQWLPRHGRAARAPGRPCRRCLRRPPARLSAARGWCTRRASTSG